MLALILFPMAEKAMHELGHLDDVHCGIEETHFCSTEHSCSICDYIFSLSAAISPDEQGQASPFSQMIDNKIFSIISNTITSQKYTLPLRGPPVA